MTSGRKLLGKRPVLSSLALLAGIGLMAAGLARGEGSVVLMKAVNVCLECIGLG